MEKNIFENLLITTFYIRYNEKKKLLNGKHFVRPVSYTHLTLPTN